jgi:ribosome maturation factor RimP
MLSPWSCKSLKLPSYKNFDMFEMLCEHFNILISRVDLWTTLFLYIFMELVRDFKGIEKKFFDLCLKIVEEQGLKLYDMEYFGSQKLLRVYIYNQETSTAVIEDCSKVDRAFTPYFETEDWLPELTLEVSSPGMFRNLKTREHFDSVVGDRVSVTISKKVDEQQCPGFSKKVYKERKFKENLVAVSDEGIELEVEDKKLFIDWLNIKKANLEPEF